MTDDFEQRVAAWLRDPPAPDPQEVERLRGYAAALPARRRFAIAWAVAASLALGAVMVSLAVWGGWRLLGNATSPGSSYPIVTSDPRFSRCGGATNPVVAAFPMAHASDYRAHFPLMGKTPVLEISDPAFVVVFGSGYTGPIMPQIVPGASAGPPATLAPGHHDVCVWIGAADSGDYYVFGAVDTTGMVATPP